VFDRERKGMSRSGRYGGLRGRYGGLYARGSYNERARTIIAIALVILYLLAKFLLPGLGRLLIGMQVPYLVLAFLLFLGWPIGAMHDKRIAVGIMAVFLLLLALHVL
jgi:hypothetical protein